MASRALIDPETGIVQRTGDHVDVVVDRYLEGCGDDLPTWSGMAHELGFASIESLANYTAKHCAQPSGEAIKRAKLRFEDLYGRALTRGGNNQAGLIFTMKNMFNWRDKSDDELRHSVVLTLTEEMREVIERLAEAMIGRIGNP